MDTFYSKDTKLIDRNRDKRNFRRTALQKIKQEIGCKMCGYNADPVALQFDHRDQSTKKFGVTQDLLRPWDSILDEAAKCDVLCANCHAIKTYSNGDHLTRLGKA